METIPVMVNGLPGNMAANAVRHMVRDTRFRVVPHSLTGPDIPEKEVRVQDTDFFLIHPPEHEAALGTIKEQEPHVLTVDYTHPTAVCANAALYCRWKLPFVMGTTGGDRERLVSLVQGSEICAVIAPNMAKQIVGFQAMMEYAATRYPGLFKGYSLTIEESHQKGKADTSGTARAMVGCFNAMGIPFAPEKITMIRDPEMQRAVWKIPEEHLAGHGWHTYTLTSPDGTVRFVFTHNVNGRDVYAQGTLDAVTYLHGKVRTGERGRVFSMIDVLEGR